MSEPLKDDTPLFRLVTYQTVLPLTASEESIDELTRHIERSGYNFAVSVERITVADLRNESVGYDEIIRAGREQEQ